MGNLDNLPTSIERQGRQGKRQRRRLGKKRQGKRQRQRRGKKRQGKKQPLQTKNTKECKDISSKCAKQKRNCGNPRFLARNNKRCQRMVKRCGACQSSNLQRQLPDTATSETAFSEC